MKEEIKISVDVSNVSNKCLRQIRNTTLNVEFIYNAILNINTNEFPPLQVDGLPFRIHDPESEDNERSPKEKAIDWLLKKAFEEFIIGLTESLVEAHKTLKLHNFANRTKTQSYTVEHINKEIEKIEKRPLNLAFPVLIQEIETELKLTLPFSEEVKSINHVRNCLVHDNGIVSQKRVNDKSKQILKLKFLELIFFAERDGKKIVVKLQDKIDGFETNILEGHWRNNQINFEIGEHVRISQNLFNNISFTCVQFVQGLFDLMPKNQEFN